MRLALLWCALAVPAFALGPFEKNHPLVAEGMAAYQKGDYQTALQKFEAAKKELPTSAALEFNRGNALYKLGRFDEARESYQQVAGLDQSDLRQRDYYNLGNAWASSGKPEEAIAAYRKALTLDPRDELARHNLEVVLRRLPPPKPDGGPDGGTPDAGQPDGGKADAGPRDAGTDGGRADGGPDGGPDGGRGDGGQDGGKGDGGQEGAKSSGEGDGGQDGGVDGGKGEEAGEPSPADGGSDRRDVRDGGSSAEAKMRKQDAEKLLDSMKHNEKNLQLWRFQPKKQRKQDDQDW